MTIDPSPGYRDWDLFDRIMLHLGSGVTICFVWLPVVLVVHPHGIENLYQDFGVSLAVCFSYGLARDVIRSWGE